MKDRAHLIAVGAFILGVAAFQMYASKLKAEVRGGDSQAVLLVTQDLKVGDTLTESTLSATEVPSDYLDARRVRAKDREHLLGVQINQALRAGEGLLWSDITDGAAHKHLAALVTPGRRAYTIEADANPLGRLLRVADHVDVLLESGGETSALLQRVLVLAVGGQIERDESLVADRSAQGNGVTLSVTTEQATQLLAAESRGRLHLILRNPEDQNVEQEQTEQPTALTVKAAAKSAETPEIEHVR